MNIGDIYITSPYSKWPNTLVMTVRQIGPHQIEIKLLGKNTQNYKSANLSLVRGRASIDIYTLDKYTKVNNITDIILNRLQN